MVDQLAGNSVGPLAGIRVVEFSQVIAAPFAGQCLADFGASVIKLEPPEGDSWRWQGAFAPSESKSFQGLNRGKESVTLRLGKPGFTDVVTALVGAADVVLINYRPDVPAKFEVDYDSLRALKPDLIYVDLTAFGRRGPWAMQPGYDGVVQAVSGLMAGEGKLQPDGSPATIVATAIADFCSGLTLADAVVAALFHRQRTGEGQFVECSLLGTALSLQGPAITDATVADAATAGSDYPTKVARRSHVPDPLYRAYLARNGAIVVAAQSDEERRCAQAFFEGATDASTIAGIVAAMAEDEAVAALHAAGVPAAPVIFPEELSDHEQVSANDWLRQLQHDTTGSQTQYTALCDFSAHEEVPLRASPPLGRDTDAVLARYGFDAAAVAKLRAAGAIGAASDAAAI